METSTEISEEVLGSQAKCSKVRILAGSPREDNVGSCEDEVEFGMENQRIKRCQYVEGLLRKLLAGA